MRGLPAYVRDFRGFKKIRIIRKGAFGKAKLLELISVKFFDSEIMQVQEGSAAFVREIDALFLLV
jgi:hypothetical protein